MKTAFLLFALCLVCTGCATTNGSNRVWYAPATWLSGHPAAEVKRAEAKEDAAVQKVDTAASAAVHAANIETAKVKLALASVPPSKARDAAVRFNANASGLLDQVSPITAAEAATLRQLVADLLSPNQLTAAAAEVRQQAEENKIVTLSSELAKAQAELTQARKLLEERQAALGRAFQKENALANELRAQQARFWILVGIAVLLLGFTIYARIALGGVGAALHAAGAPAAVISALDANLSSLGQWLIRTGRTAAAKAEAALAVKTSGTP